MRYIQGIVENGVMLRSPREEDAAALVEYVKQFCGETPFLAAKAEEMRVTEDGERQRIREFENSQRGCIIDAWIGGRLAGQVQIEPISDRMRMRHRAALGIGVLREFWSRGIGTMLMDAAIQTAASASYRQIELAVVADNDRAIRLYKDADSPSADGIPRASAATACSWTKSSCGENWCNEG